MGDVRCRMDDILEQSKGSIKRIYKQQELPDSKLYIEWKDGSMEEYVLFDKLRIQLGSVLKTPIDLVTKIIEPHKRAYTKAVNAATESESEENEDENEDEDIDVEKEGKKENADAKVTEEEEED